MKFFSKSKDGGPNSTVTAYWLLEIKKLFSVALLRFDDGTRDEFHDHAFNSFNWILKGEVQEEFPSSSLDQTLSVSWKPYFTSRSRMHRVRSKGTTWVFTLRGPWVDTWHEFNRRKGVTEILTHGRKVVDSNERKH